MKDMTTAALFGVVAKCSLRFNGAVQHLYSDKGSNLRQENLFGESNGVFIHQNISHTQLRNVSESSTAAVKRLLLQLTENKTTNLFDFEYFLEVIAAEHNNTPFLESGNSQLWAPIDGIIPRVGIETEPELIWKGTARMKAVRNLATQGKEVAELVRKAMISSFLSNAKFWLPKGFRGRNQVQPRAGDLIRITYNSRIGVIEEVSEQTLIVRLRGGQRVTVHRTNVDIIVSTCISMTPAVTREAMMKKNVFLAVPVEEECRDILLEVQAKLKETIEGNTKWTKDSAMHCTLGLLNLDSEEQAKEIKNRLDGAIDSITTNQCNDHEGKCKLGFLAAIKQVEFWQDDKDEGMIVAIMDPGFTSLGNIRSALEEILGSAITEKQPWKGHITLARKVADSKQNRAAVNSINIGKKGEPTIGSAFPLFKVELRWLKKKALDDEGKEVPSDMKEFESAKWFASVFPEFLKDTGHIATWDI